MIDETRIRDWLAAYHHAWTTDDPQEVARLFTDDVLFYNAPFTEPLTGADRVVEYWLEEAESGIPWSFEYQVLAQEGDLFVVRAVTTYPEGTQGAEAPRGLPQPLARDADATTGPASSWSTSCSCPEPPARRPTPGRVDSAAVHSRASARGEHDGGAGDGPRGRGGTRGETAGGARRSRVLRQVRRAVPAAAARGALRRDHQGVPRDRERRRRSSPSCATCASTSRVGRRRCTTRARSRSRTAAPRSTSSARTSTTPARTS